MIKSMTGYGKAECELAAKKITIEIKTLNSKNIDIHTKIPSYYREKELEIRNLLTDKLQRGKVEISLYYEITDEAQAAEINGQIVKSYYQQLKGIADEVGIEASDALLQTVMRLPDTLRMDRTEIDDEEWHALKRIIIEAADEVNRFREQEGRSLQTDVTNHIKSIQSYLPEIEVHEKQRVDKIRNRIANNFNEFFGDKDIDKNRLEQEILYYLEKLDINEEKVRLDNHCNYFLEMIEDNEPVGKKLGFICQEIGREINTVGSKANDYEIQRRVVLMKDELEKVKEQIANVL
ncbi:MAG: YicC/YloC family endoribonuclease [Bacteroidales bacterium]